MKILKLFILLLTFCLLFSCSRKKDLIDHKAKKIEKIVVVLNKKDVEIEITDKEEIEDFIDLVEDEYVTKRKDDRSFQEKWNSMGSSITTKRKYDYHITIYPKEGEEYLFSIGLKITYYDRNKEETTDTEYFKNQSFRNIEGKFYDGTVSDEFILYLEELFAEE